MTAAVVAEGERAMKGLFAVMGALGLAGKLLENAMRFDAASACYMAAAAAGAVLAAVSFTQAREA